MNQPLRLAIINLRITAVIYWILGVGLLFFPLVYIGMQALFGVNWTVLPELGPFGNLVAVTLYCWFAALFAIGPAIFLEFIIRGLKRYRYWAWICGVIMCGIYVPSGFMLFGILGLVGLLNRDVINEFNQRRQNNRPPA